MIVTSMHLTPLAKGLDKQIHQTLLQVNNNKKTKQVETDT